MKSNGVKIKASRAHNPMEVFRGIEDGVGLSGVDHLSCPS